MSGKVEVFDTEAIAASLKKISDDILKDFSSTDDFVIIGIQTRGVELSLRLKELLQNKMQCNIQTGFIDVSFHRDDLTTRGRLPEIKETSLDFDVNGKNILLVDDVLFTGRTTKAALETLMSFGRPASIKLAVLVDRGGRELPIQADYFCFKLDTEKTDSVKVVLSVTDKSDDSVILIENNN